MRFVLNCVVVKIDQNPNTKWNIDIQVYRCESEFHLSNTNSYGVRLSLKFTSGHIWVVWAGQSNNTANCR